MAAKGALEGDLDALFKLPQAEFIAARNALAARLKKTGDRNEAEQVKALVKPTLSAWAVNQLYWKHGDTFKELLAARESFGRTPAAGMRDLLAARREVISRLTRLAAVVLEEAGHSPTPDILRRITTTLEALSASASSSDAPVPGRLSADVDPPGFESLEALIPNAGPRIIQFQPSKAKSEAAEENLRVARSAAHEADAALKKATALANEAERERRVAEDRLKKAEAAAEEARQRRDNAAVEAEKAAKDLEVAERAVEKQRK